MSIIHNDSIRGYRIEGEIGCANCATDEEQNAAEQDTIITDSDIENDDSHTYFCDRDQKQL
jgi:hypothetical protein